MEFSLLPIDYIFELPSSPNFLGGQGGGGTPGPIPNPVVKPVSADGTWGATPRESRSLPRGFSFNFASGIMVGLDWLKDGHACPKQLKECEAISYNFV